MPGITYWSLFGASALHCAEGPPDLRRIRNRSPRGRGPFSKKAKENEVLDRILIVTFYVHVS